jgi:hypothetical protein
LTVRFPTLTSALADMLVRVAANPVMPELAAVPTNSTDAEERLM